MLQKHLNYSVQPQLQNTLIGKLVNFSIIIALIELGSMVQIYMKQQ